MTWRMLAGLIAAAIIIGGAVPFLAYRPAHAAGMTCGEISWYGRESGNRTATGERFDGSGMTMAVPRRSMLGKTYTVTDMRTGRSVQVRANDIGPAGWTGRIGDLSAEAAQRLGFKSRGLTRACVSG